MIPAGYAGQCPGVGAPPGIPGAIPGAFCDSLCAEV